MFIIDRIKALKIILLFSLVNGSVFVALKPQGFSLVRISIVLMMLISVLLLITFFCRIDRKNFILHPYFKFLFFLLIFWSMFTILRSVSFDSKDLMSLFAHYLMGCAWIVPLATIFGLNIFNWINIFDFLGKLVLVGVVLSPILLITTDIHFGSGVIEYLFLFPFLLLTNIYQKPFYKKVAFLAIIIFVFVSIYTSQRVNALYILLVIFFLIIETLRYRYNSVTKKALVSMMVSLVILVISIQAINIFNDIKKNKKLTVDTRTFLFTELYKDFSNTELIMGRGALGTYYSPYFAILKRARIKGGDSPVRSVSEVGYLEMILKGGYIMMILYLLVLIPAAYLGIFKSKNMIARMSGYIISMYLIAWTISYVPVYDAQFILLWMAVGTAVSPRARNITDEELLRLRFNNKN